MYRLLRSTVRQKAFVIRCSTDFRLDSTSSSTNVHRRLNNDYHDDRHDIDYNNNNDDDEDEDDWKPQKKKRRSTQPSNVNSNQHKSRRKTIKELNNLVLTPQMKTPSIDGLDFQNCIIPLDKLWFVQLSSVKSSSRVTRLCFSPRAQHVVIPIASSSTTSSMDDLFVKTRHVSTTPTTGSSSPTLSSLYYVRSPFNLVEDESSATQTVIMFQEDTQ